MKPERVCKNIHRTSDGNYLIIGSLCYGTKVLTKEGIKSEVERKAFAVTYENDELYARHIRASENLRKPNSFEIFDELPEGWTTNLSEHGVCGLRGRHDIHSAYVWCENMPYYDYSGPYPRKNEGYRMCLVRRTRNAS